MSNFELERLLLFLGVKYLICSQRLFGFYFLFRYIVGFLFTLILAALVWLVLLLRVETLSSHFTPVYLSTIASVLDLGFSYITDKLLRLKLYLKLYLTCFLTLAFSFCSLIFYFTYSLSRWHIWKLRIYFH